MTDHIGFSPWKLPSRVQKTSTLELDYLKNRASWIRDELDPLVAREGPGILRLDTVVTLFKFFEQLRTSHTTLEFLRDSRIHFALLDIAGRATRWPTKLIDKAEEIVHTWELEWGPLAAIRPNVYGPGGRLHGISTPEDLQRDVLLIKWARKETAWVNSNFARRNGDLGFEPGDWWINTMFAFHDGIIAHSKNDSRVTNCYEKAYALLLTDSDELDCTDPAHFTYRSTPGDARRYRLCAGTPASRQPVRVLRSHTLRSFWSPRAGVRYDGLYKVSGWRITQDPTTKKVVYHISFDRLPSEPPMGPILNRPSAEELDDYREYKRIRKETRQHRNLLHRGLPIAQLDTNPLSKTDSHDTTATAITKSPTQKKRSSSSQPQAPQPESTEPSSAGPISPANLDDNPFFSGALDSQSGLGKINTLRPDVINYAPVLDAASAAGASIDPFFARALEEQAAKRAAALRPGPSAPSPVPAKLNTVEGTGTKPPAIGFVGVVKEAGEKKKSIDLSRRDSKGKWECPIRRRSKSG